jgi:hypothetical protein
MITIPETVLTKIAEHRPHLALMIRNLRSKPALAAQIEKAIAGNYLSGETRLSPMETHQLSACCIGEKFGGGPR